MKRLLPLSILMCVILMYVFVNLPLAESSSVYNVSSGDVYTDTVYLDTILVNQDPYPAEPNGYVDLRFKIENRGTESAKNVTVELLPSYPFSLDPGVSATQELGTIQGLQYEDNAYTVNYKVMVNKDAVDDTSQINLKYSYDGGGVYTQTFDVKVSNPRTDFDVIVQDSTATSTTLAIANIGANTAYSVIIKIPEQENFRVTGTSASILSNLAAGDYTLASFQITSISTAINATTGRGSTNATISGGTAEKNLSVEISYTDTLGIRRTVQKEVLSNAIGTVVGQTGTQSTQGGLLQTPISSGLMYIGIGVVGITVIVVFLKFRKNIKRKKK